MLVIGSSWFGLIGMAAMAVALVVLALLSKRLGSVTRSPRYYRILYLSTGLVIISLLGRIFNLLRGADLHLLRDDPLWVTIYVGLPALALTLAVITGWRYWSWLLAERG